MRVKRYLSSREWLSLFVIGALGMMMILPIGYYFAYGYIPEIWLRESGLYETTGAIACFVAGLLNLVSFRVWWNQKQHLASLWMLLFALGCLLLAGEEISWGQHFFKYDLSDNIVAANFQQEFNLHNSRLIQSSNNLLSNIALKLLAIYLTLLPMLLVVFPTVEKWFRRLRMPIPSMLIAIITLVAGQMYRVSHNITGNARMEEMMESIFQICLLILAIECFYMTKRKVRIDLAYSVE